MRGPLTACSITWAERASACAWRPGTIEAAEKKLASQLVAQLEAARVVRLVGQLGHARVVCPCRLLVQSLGVEGPAQLQRQLGPPARIRRRLGGVREVLGGFGPAERGLGGSEFGEHVGAQFGSRRLFDRTRQVADRGLGGARLARGRAQLLDHPRVAAGVRQQQVRGDALDLDSVGVEQPRRVEMAGRALEQRDVLLDRVLDKGVHEPKRRAREQHLGPGQRIRGAACRLQREAGERRGAPQGSVGAEDRDGAGERGRIGAESANADSQRSDHGVGGQGASAARQLGTGHAGLLGERGQQFVQVERVAAGHLDGHLRQIGVGAIAEGRAGEFPRRVGAQGRQPLQSDPGMAADPVERRRGLTARVGSASHDHRGRQLVEPVQDVEHELERCRVAAVQIVDRQQRGPRLGRPGHDRKQAVGQGEVTRVAWLGQVLAGAGQRAHPLGRLAQEGPAGRAREVGHEGSDELAGDAEGQILLELGARGAQHPHAAASALVERRLM